jgi:hypothetical protein
MTSGSGGHALPKVSPKPAMPFLFMLCTLKRREFHDQGDANWIVIRGQLKGYNDMPTGSQPPAGLSAAWELAAFKAYLVFLVTINYQYYFPMLSS